MERTTALALLATVMIALAPPTLANSSPSSDSADHAAPLAPRADSYRELTHLRNGHACIMSIVFLVLYPLGGIAVHLPTGRIPVLRDTYLRRAIPAIHAPIQLLGTAMLIGAMALGIRMARDYGFLYSGQKHPPVHVVLGLCVACSIVAIQPALGLLQHRYFKRAGQRSWFGRVHRGFGRVAILLGAINNGLGFQLAARNTYIPTKSYVRNFVVFGSLVLIWVALVVFDEVLDRRARRAGTVETGEKGKGLPEAVVEGRRES